MCFYEDNGELFDLDGQGWNLRSASSYLAWWLLSSSCIVNSDQSSSSFAVIACSTVMLGNRRFLLDCNILCVASLLANFCTVSVSLQLSSCRCFTFIFLTAYISRILRTKPRKPRATASLPRDLFTNEALLLPLVRSRLIHDSGCGSSCTDLSCTARHFLPPSQLREALKEEALKKPETGGEWSIARSRTM